MRHPGRRSAGVADNIVGMGLEIGLALLIMLIALGIAVVVTGGRF